MKFKTTLFIIAYTNSTLTFLAQNSKCQKTTDLII